MPKPEKYLLSRIIGALPPAPLLGSFTQRHPYYLRSRVLSDHTFPLTISEMAVTINACGQIVVIGFSVKQIEQIAARSASLNNSGVDLQMLRAYSQQASIFNDKRCSPLIGGRPFFAAYFYPSLMRGRMLRRRLRYENSVVLFFGLEPIIGFGGGLDATLVLL